MLFKDMKTMVRSLDGDTDFFDDVTGVLQGDTLVPYIFIICLDYILKTSLDLIKENGFTLKRQKADNISQKLTDTDYTDNLVLLANTSTQTVQPGASSKKNWCLRESR